MKNKQYTIAVFTENHIGLLNQLTIIFTRRKMNIESLTVSESQIKGIHSFTITVMETADRVAKVTRSIERLVEVLKAFYYDEEELIAQEIALYKISMDAVNVHGVDMGRFIRQNGARILDMHKEYFVIEKTGTKQETQELLEKLRPYGVLEFIRSGRVAITKPMKVLETYLEEEENAHNSTLD